MLSILGYLELLSNCNEHDILLNRLMYHESNKEGVYPRDSTIDISFINQ